MRTKFVFRAMLLCIACTVAVGQQVSVNYNHDASFAQFAQIPGGPNHVASTLVNGVSRQLTVSTQNSNYEHK
jgi:hypothetical protein